MTNRSWSDLRRLFALKLTGRLYPSGWRGLAIRQYDKKYREDADYRYWVETDAPRWVAEHWGHGTAVDGFVRTHLTSQLYELTNMLRKRLGSLNNVNVLDAGASDGLFLERLGASKGVGINFLISCGQKIKSDGYTACVGDVGKLPFEDKSFDYVICCETLEHVPDPIGTLNELARVCRKRICLSIPWLPNTRFNARPAGWPEKEGHIFEFSESDFLKILSWTNVRLAYNDLVQVFPEPRNPFSLWLLEQSMYPSFFPRLQYYELETS